MGILLLFIAGCVGVSVLLFLQYHLYATTWKTDKSKKILLLGLPNAGKTLVWQRLTSDKPPKPTVTSLEPNEGQFVPDCGGSDVLTPAERLDMFRKVAIRDLPGRLDRQHRVISEELNSAAGLVFIIDSCNQESARSSASFLFQVLASTAYQSHPLPVCIFFNKQGFPGARHRNLLREEVEREIENLKRYHETNLLQKAMVPVVRTTLLGRLVSRLPFQCPRRPQRPVKAALTKAPAQFFRLANINSPYFLLVQELNLDASIERLKGFVQRASLIV
eukprot:Protomagalhaensia_sp_Gyna_25__3794@NODE_340_length_3816_cov_13_376489_g266_i0_p2_GENE_NODE_340_length_3816_cov_13_376489_g266_i0NODE_340_length_3816_cov_13_376489_g266_i0_p2_ORF_typecomplete_len276_score30_19SRPRB/PF09439_10/2e26Arf/PF00025_21/9_2e13FeoB_N/PF02421_18/0_00032Gtr1_RagA/PF04670_12/0_00048MMR_HSR1/PF01926_23/0_003AAA_22/PF13401_6/0_077AAA_22/PF13401_6/4_7e02Ras/PF00071_22/0_023Roc/PF08477_13/0_075_NODE_340_length_3816_cov_13_376489_g266_i05401367